MSTFWKLFKSSIVLRFTLAVLLTATICTLYLIGRVVPPQLWGAEMLILGYVFGSVGQLTNAIKEAKQAHDSD